ncbi:unnamed protein product [Durusdinium trenchii]|uniref:catechol O-methyltransferase n=1 Tax=Durusdinium trenchii TaxID=1381693 RepID=A0ABP0RI80_9DINO
MLKSAYASFNDGARNGRGLRSTERLRSSQWYSPEELSSFGDGVASVRPESVLSAPDSVAESSATQGLSFYGKGPSLAKFSPPSRRPERRDASNMFRDKERERELSEQVAAGQNVFVMPKRPPRSNECYALDKDLSGAGSPSDALDLAMAKAEVMDAPNWANLLYALAHWKKKGGHHLAASLRSDSRWSRSLQRLQASLQDLTARDAANVVWSLATLEAKQEPLFLETADALCGKLAVCDPVSISKAAWALTSIPNRDRRLELYSKLAVPVVMRADSFPLGSSKCSESLSHVFLHGSLTMICYSFGKADFREGDAYEALSSALIGHMNNSLRPIDVCNVIWSFCTVGYRDDVLFTKICEMYLTKEEMVRDFNPQDLTNTTWGFCKVGFCHREAMETLAFECHRQRDRFDPIHFSNLLYSFAMLRIPGPPSLLAEVASTASQQVARFDAGNLAIACWALAALGMSEHPFLDCALERVIGSSQVCSNLGSRALSMLALACFRTARPGRLDQLLDATRLCGLGVGASGYSAAVMAAEQGKDQERELRILRQMAAEARDVRMQAAVCNSLALRLWKRGDTAGAFAVLRGLKESSPHSWSVVSSLLVARLGTELGALAEASELLGGDGAALDAAWEAPVLSGIHPMAATRQNEGAHAYTREFMTLHAVLCGAPPGDPDAAMAAIERFAESRSLWLKITAWEKGVVVQEVARWAQPRLTVEIGAYVGYSAMNVARTVRSHGGRVASLEVDPLHVTLVRNMLEYAGLSDVVDVWTGYSFDSIPHLLKTYGPRSVDMVFMDQKGTRFHSDLALMEELDLLSDRAVILADNVLKPGAPLYIWHLAKGSYHHCTAISVREFLLQSEDWMVMAFRDASKPPAPTPPPELHRLAFESDHFRKKSMFDGVAPSKSDWWKFSQGFVTGLELCGCKPRIVGLHGRDNPKITPEDVARIFRTAAEERGGEDDEVLRGRGAQRTWPS